MPRGDKSKYTDKQKRQARHIEAGYKEQGVSEEEAESRAWATVNAMDHGGKKPGGSGRGKSTDKEPAKKGGRKGGSRGRSATEGSTGSFGQESCSHA
jgi:plasmid stabilization system protein ParE